MHQVVLAALLTSNPIYSVYFLSSNGEFDADYSAVVAVKRGYAHDSSNKVQVKIHSIIHFLLILYHLFMIRIFMRLLAVV